MAIRLTVYLVKPALLDRVHHRNADGTQALRRIAAKGCQREAEAQIGMISLRDDHPLDEVVDYALALACLDVKIDTQHVAGRYVWMNLSNPLSVPQVNEPAAPPVEIR